MLLHCKQMQGGKEIEQKRTGLIASNKTETGLP